MAVATVYLTCKSLSEGSLISPTHSMPITRGQGTASPECPCRVMISARLMPKAFTRINTQPGLTAGVRISCS